MEKQELIQKIKNILVQVRPYLAADGGGVEFVDLTDDMIVLVELTGACGNCPHSSKTLKNGQYLTTSNLRLKFLLSTAPATRGLFLPVKLIDCRAS